MIAFCEESFNATGGLPTNPGARWQSSYTNDIFSFREESDELVFVLAFTKE